MAPVSNDGMVSREPPDIENLLHLNPKEQNQNNKLVDNHKLHFFESKSFFFLYPCPVSNFGSQFC